MMDSLVVGGLMLNAIKPSWDFLVSVKGAYDSYQQKRTKMFVEDVFRDAKHMTINDVHKNDILHNFYMTLDYIQKVRKQEQLNHFKEILQTYLQDNRLQQEYDDGVHNNYELVLNMINNLSYIEFELLVMLYRYEKPYHDKSLKVKSIEYWDSLFIKEAQNKFQLEYSVIIGLFQTLHAKGMFYISGSVGFGDSDVKVGTLTKLFLMIISYMPSVK